VRFARFALRSAPGIQDTIRVADLLSEADLPIIDELGDQLYAGALRAASSRAGTASAAKSGKRTLSRAFRRRAAAAVAVAAAFGIGGVAGLGLGGSAVADRHQAQSLGQLRAAPALPPELGVAATERDGDAFGILRRAPSQADAVPQSMVSRLMLLLDAGGGRQQIGEIRRAEGFASGGAWVVTLDGYICLFASAGNAVLPPPPALGASGCVSALAALNGGMTVHGGGSRFSGRSFVAGLVPDGVANVKVALDGGGTVTAAVRDNVYMATLDGYVHSVSYNVAGRHVTKFE
jgi:hypothetical protein